MRVNSRKRLLVDVVCDTNVRHLKTYSSRHYGFHNNMENLSLEEDKTRYTDEPQKFSVCEILTALQRHRMNTSNNGIDRDIHTPRSVSPKPNINMKLEREENVKSIPKRDRNLNASSRDTNNFSNTTPSKCIVDHNTYNSPKRKAEKTFFECSPPASKCVLDRMLKDLGN
jgi:hypothetical protein